jgi:hypothetical protein
MVIEGRKKVRAVYLARRDAVGVSTKCLLVSCCCVVLTSCISTSDISAESLVQGGYMCGETLLMQRDLAIDGRWLSAREDVVQSYQVGRPQRDVVGLLRQNDRVRIVRVLLRKHPDVGNTIHPIARVETGPWTGREVDLRFVSTNVGSATMRGALVTLLTNNADLLKKETPKR